MFLFFDLLIILLILILINDNEVFGIFLINDNER